MKNAHRSPYSVTNMFQLPLPMIGASSRCSMYFCSINEVFEGVVWARVAGYAKIKNNRRKFSQRKNAW